MSERGKVVIIIPAFDEEHSIGSTIDLIKQTGIKAEIIVVNDGSKDKTEQIAREKGCFIISFSVNRGKANAFFAGVKKAIEREAVAMITLDADMLSVPKEGLEELISLAKEATLRKKSSMIIAPVVERHTGYTIHVSGIRAFSLPALFKLKASRLKSIPVGFGLEEFLNFYFAKEKIISRVNFVAMSHLRKPRTFRNRQDDEINRTYKKMEKIERTLHKSRRF